MSNHGNITWRFWTISVLHSVVKMAEMTHMRFNDHNYQKEASRLIIKVSEHSLVILDMIHKKT